MAKYVKFLRGTPAAYENLRHKDPDTLYFIYEEDESAGILYLGTKIIAGADIEGSYINVLSDLKDVLIKELSMDSLLVYDSNSATWINKTLEEMLFVGATEHSAGKIGLVPSPELGKTDLFLKSDGTWASPIVEHTLLTLVNNDELNHNDLILQHSESLGNVNGDIIIIKDKIANDKWQYTSYVFDGNVWRAMDGNYNADNVYFDSDLITTSEVGHITLTNGNATIAAAGKNLRQVFESIFMKEFDPKVTIPSCSVTLGSNSNYEVGSIVAPSYTLTFYKGKYEFGPDTGITVDSIEVSNGSEKLTTSSGTFKSITLKDDDKVTISAKVKHSDGSIPLSNMSNECPHLQIKTNTVSNQKSGYMSYRNTFFGTLVEKEDLTNEVIRSLDSSNKGLKNGDVVTVNIPIGAKRIVFAYPAELNDLSSVKDTNGFNAEIIDGFKRVEIDVEGANHYLAKPYKVYYLDYANSNDKINSYVFTINEGGIK